MIYPMIATNEYTYPFLNNFANFGNMVTVTVNEKHYYVTAAHIVRQIGDYVVKNDFDFWLYTELRKCNVQEDPIWLFNRRDKVNIPVFTYKLLTQTINTGYAEIFDLIAVEYPATETQETISDIEIDVGDEIELIGYVQKDFENTKTITGTIESIEGWSIKINFNEELEYGLSGSPIYKNEQLIGCYSNAENAYLLKTFF
jgi:hypothetical protein